jgi:hypothetical protein
MVALFESGPPSIMVYAKHSMEIHRGPMSGKNRRIVTDEPVEFEK